MAVDLRAHRSISSLTDITAPDISNNISCIITLLIVNVPVHLGSINTFRDNTYVMFCSNCVAVSFFASCSRSFVG